MERKISQNVLGASLLLCLLLLTGCREEAILHELSEVQANRVLVALEKAGIHAEKKHEGQSWSIVTPEDVATTALATLEESRVLRNDLERSHSTGSASLVQSREERMQLVERQLAASLESTLETLPDVLQARVHLFLDTADKLSLLPNAPKQTASVLLISERPDGIDRGQVQKLVSGASGIVVEQITVLVSNSKDTVARSAGTMATPTPQRGGATESAPLASARSAKSQELMLPVTLGLLIVVCCFLLFYGYRSSRRKRQRLRPPSSNANAFEPPIEVSLPTAAESLNGNSVLTADEVF